ncbi:hypothetical protein [Bradyrhizobium sp. USDA 10063]
MTPHLHNAISVLLTHADAAAASALASDDAQPSTRDVATLLRAVGLVSRNDESLNSSLMLLDHLIDGSFEKACQDYPERIREHLETVRRSIPTAQRCAALASV